MAAYLRAAILLAEKFQCLIIIIHHCGHNQDRPRGHSSLLGNTDVSIEIKKDADGAVCSTVEEMRDGPSGAQTRSRLEVVDVIFDDDGNPITSCVIVETGPSNNGHASNSNSKAKKAAVVSPKGLVFYNALINAAATPGIGVDHYEAGNREQLPRINGSPNSSGAAVSSPLTPTTKKPNTAGAPWCRNIVSSWSRQNG